MEVKRSLNVVIIVVLVNVVEVTAVKVGKGVVAWVVGVRGRGVG